MPKTKSKLSYVIQNNTLPTKHQAGINCFCYEDSLFTGSRDATVIEWRDYQFQNKLQHHTDWINDILWHKGLFTCSSDKSILFWGEEPVLIGYHEDVVKRITMVHNLLCSGGLDQKINLWDIERQDKIGTMDNSKSSNGSIYCLSGRDSLVVSGSPDKLVKLWDSRSYSIVSSLVGHTDVVRDLLLSQDGHSVISCSSDATVKLWTTKMPNRCIHTWTQPEESCWSLFSNDPNLDTFMVGTRDGYVYKCDNQSKDMMVVLKEEDPILRLGIVNDQILVVTPKSSLHFYNNPSFEDPLHHPSIIQDYNQSDLPVPESVSQSVDPSPRVSLISKMEEPVDVKPVYDKPLFVIQGLPSLTKYTLLNDKRRVVTLDTENRVQLWNIVECKLIKTLVDAKYEDVVQQEQTSEWIANWCTIDTKIGSLAVHIEEGKCQDAEMYYQDLGLERTPENEDQRITIVRWVLTWLLFKYFQTWMSPTPEHPGYDLKTPGLMPLSPTATPQTNLPSQEETHKRTPSAEKKSAMSLLMRKISGNSKQSTPQLIVPDKIPEPHFYINYDETPEIDISPNTRLILSSDENGTMMDTFRSTIAQLDDQENIAKIYKHLPQWIHQWLVLDQPIQKDPAKLSFQLVPYQNAGMPEIPKDQSRLTGNRMLRMKKVLMFIGEKLNVTIDPYSWTLEGKPTKYVQILCNDKVMSPRTTLATVKHYYWKSGGDIILHYRQVQ
ncbi:WD40-repeat-containing domain protein [Gorgonomyces haynaldii]|nr:WD40-repeat-containing domain protein [Gorgonomyces haynaldii]